MGKRRLLLAVVVALIGSIWSASMAQVNTCMEIAVNSEMFMLNDCPPGGP